MKFSRVQKYLLLEGDIESAILFRVMRKKVFNRQHFKLHPDLFTDDECKLMFRFKKQDLFLLCEALELPKVNRTQMGNKFRGIEGMQSYILLLFYNNLVNLILM